MVSDSRILDFQACLHQRTRELHSYLCRFTCLELYTTSDMRINTGKRMVACAECHSCLRDTPEYAGILQSKGAILRSAIPLTHWESFIFFRRRSCKLLVLVQRGTPHHAGRPPGNDRYVRHAPDNPKKVVTSTSYSFISSIIDDVAIDTL